MNIHVWQHVPFEGPASIRQWAMSRNLAVECVPVWQVAPRLPGPETRLVVVMGGPMGVHDTTEHPWLLAEKQCLREVIDAGIPLLGVCLGAQLIADVLGATVTKNAHREIGWFAITRDECVADTWLGPLWPDTLQVLHWHGDTFAIPAEATRLAGSHACANQGFLYRDHVLGLQCHLETTAAWLERLLHHCSNELDDSRFVQDAGSLREGLKHSDAMHAVLGHVLDGLMEQDGRHD
ncbi:MAG: amidotransferase [Gammaproteobacteria bacterium]|nr:MAG: amidotransferase [Gammaproteobacteria bacterium]